MASHSYCEREVEMRKVDDCDVEGGLRSISIQSWNLSLTLTLFLFFSTFLYSYVWEVYISCCVWVWVVFFKTIGHYLRGSPILVRITYRGNHYQSYHFSSELVLLCRPFQIVSNSVHRIAQNRSQLACRQVLLSIALARPGLVLSFLAEYVFKCRSEPDTHQPNSILSSFWAHSEPILSQSYTKWKVSTKKRNDKKLKPKPVFSLKR